MDRTSKKQRVLQEMKTGTQHMSRANRAAGYAIVRGARLLIGHICGRTICDGFLHDLRKTVRQEQVPPGGVLTLVWVPIGCKILVHYVPPKACIIT